MTDRPILFSAPMVRALLDGTKTQTRRIVEPQPPVVGAVTRISGQDYSLFTDRHFPGSWRVAGSVGVVRDIMGDAYPSTGQWSCRYGTPGDRLWVRETWAVGACADAFSPSALHAGTWLHDNGGLWYPADGAVPKTPISPRGKTRVSIHMPRWASRITLGVTEVRVERLQAISNQDAFSEGIEADVWDQAVVCRDYSQPHDRGLGDEPFQMWADNLPNYVETDEIGRASYRTLWDSINGVGSWDANPFVWAISFKRLTESEHA